MPMLHRPSAPSGEVGAAVEVTSRDEAGLIRRVARGELRAFEELYRVYHPRLTRFIVHRIRRPHLVEEVLNDTMLVVWTRAGSYTGVSKVSTWIFAIAYRKSMAALRGLDEPMEDEHAETRQSPEPGPEDQLGRRQIEAALSNAMGELSADHRSVVDLTYFHEMGYREIADIMGCPEGTVKTRMHHARQRLKTALAGGLVDWL
jgi:RNA polymerase sigma-70 factor (ECF subfamily)